MRRPGLWPAGFPALSVVLVLGSVALSVVSPAYLWLFAAGMAGFVVCLSLSVRLATVAAARPSRARVQIDRG